ncbi:MAG: ATP-binding protein [Acidobacteriaceae bacterium]|nr:ATP-binding protein [Acidobacteriaceae bacterium]
MYNQTPNSDPSRLGTVEDVNGSSISVKLSENTPSGLLFVNGEAYRVGQVGGFVRIPSGYFDLFGIISQVGAGAAPGPPELAPQLGNRWLRVELVGEGRRGVTFERGISQYPSIGDPVHVATESDLKTVYAPGNGDEYIAIGRVSSAESIRAFLDINKLVSRHSAIVGSTGSGKSTAVANILSVISDRTRFKSARVVLFDIHGEYANAFGNLARVFRVGADINSGEKELHVPFWALTSEEFISIAMGSVSGVPLTFIHEKILADKQQSKPGGITHKLNKEDITIDTPLPFSVFGLWHGLYSLHNATHTVSSNQNQSDNTRAYMMSGTPPMKMLGNPDTLEAPQFCPESKGGNNPIYLGEHNKLTKTHLDVMENKLRDPRLQFLFRPGEWSVATDGTTKTDLDSLFSAWIGADTPISVFDLSGIPPTILDDLIGAVLRILYDALFWGRLKPEGSRERPLLIVLEEAHSYLGTQPAGSQVKYRAAAATRRIAKEGRKYGVGLMLVSQRPSEIDSTILAQCGSTVALRLTNESDQSQVSKCASDNLKGLFSALPILRTGEALIVGEAVNMPVRAIIDRPAEERRPDSGDPMVVVPMGASGKRVRGGGWTEPIISENYRGVVEAWRKQNPRAGNANIVTKS